MSGLKIWEFAGLQEMRKYIFSASSIADDTWQVYINPVTVVALNPAEQLQLHPEI